MAPQTASIHSDANIKLSCKNLWVVYGADAKGFFNHSTSFDSDALADRMMQQGHIPAAIDVSFELQLGEIFVIMGLSGSGKSTLLRGLSRLVEPCWGEILFDGSNLLEATHQELIEIRRHKMGMVFQNFGLLPHLTVFENVAFPLKIQNVPVNERYEQVRRVIDLVGLTGRENSFPRQLSGGQQQRVGIARSLAVEPEVWFLDEPFSALDPLIRRQMQDEFLRIQQLLHKSIVFITHDFLEAIRVADRMAIMRDGKFVQMGTPEELIFNPVDNYVAQFSREVPRTRVLKAHQIVEPPNGDTGDIPEVESETSVEKLLPILAENPRGVLVKDDSRQPLGIITPEGIVQSLSRFLQTDSNDSDAAASD